MGTLGDGSLDRVAQRQRAVALARHYREAEGLSIAQIAERLGRAPATVKGYFYDPTSENAKGYKEKHRRRCARCVRPTAAKKSMTDALAALLASEPPRAYGSVSDLSERPQDETQR